MSFIIAIIVVLTILVVVEITVRARRGPPDEEMLAAPAKDGGPVEDCTTRFFIKKDDSGEPTYCVTDGNHETRCENSPIAAIISANEHSDPARCNKISWGFGCKDKGLFCGLQQSGPYLVSKDTADKIAQKQCGLPWPRLWC